jgi:uncharacterized protein (TIGR02466 family)
MAVSLDAAEILHLFPTFLWRADLKPAEFEPLNAALLQRLVEIGAPLNGLRSGQNWQSDHGLQDDPRLASLMEVVMAASQNLLTYLKIDVPLAVTGCWANVNAPGTGHRLHSHRNNFLSGVYYVQVQDQADTINFFDPRPQAGVIRPQTSQSTAENTEVASLRITNGTLLLFPAWLPHAVDINRSQRPRISLSFNLMFRDFAERMGRPNWTPGTGGPG